MKVTLKDLLHSINVLEEDVDVTVDGIDSIAVCSPIQFTPEGLKEFEKALNVESKGCCVGSNSSEEDCEEVWRLLSALAGYCSSGNYETWFEGDNSKEI